jgi:tetratricopeptide (TPR) repeat protein
VILPLLALAAAQAAAPAPTASQSDQALFHACADVAKSSPEKAVEQANDWYLRGGGIFARQCLGLAYTSLERWAPAAVAFEQAARLAESAQDPRRSDFWVQSGNSWLAADDPTKARSAFDSALATGSIAKELQGEVYLDRARADVALNDPAAARADLDKGLELVPDDPFAWLLSANLAMRQESLARAQADIAKALQLAPGDADVLVQAGNIAGASGDTEAARSFFTRAVQADPGSEAAKAAQAALGENGSGETNASPAAVPTIKEPKQ